MPFIAGAMLGGSILSGIAGRSSAKKMARAIRDQARVQRDILNFNRERFDHFVETFGDLERQVVADAVNGVEADIAGVTGRAAADVEANFDGQIDRQRRDLQRFGIDPSSGRFASSDRSLGVQRAATSALAQNTQRENERRRAEDQTRALRLQVNQFGTSLRENAAQGVTNAGNSLSNTFGQQAGVFGNLAGNLFSQAGQLGVMGVGRLAGNFSQPSSIGSTPFGSLSPSGSFLPANGGLLPAGGQLSGGISPSVSLPTNGLQFTSADQFGSLQPGLGGR